MTFTSDAERVINPSNVGAEHGEKIIFRCIAVDGNVELVDELVDGLGHEADTLGMDVDSGHAGGGVVKYAASWFVL